MSFGGKIVISHIITTFNRKDVVLAHLYALQMQTYRDFEVIVISDGSHDGTVGEVLNHRFNFSLTIVQLPNESHRVAYARNVGIKLARGDVLVIGDDDLMPCPEYLQVYDETVQECAVLGYTVHMDHLKSNDNLWRNCGGNVGISRGDAVRIGMYDESFTTYGLEDLEFGIRLHLHDIPVIYEPRAFAEEVNAPYGLDGEQKKRSLLRNLSRLESKYPNLDSLLSGWEFYDWMKAERLKHV